LTIKYIYDGDLFESKADALVNTVNCVGVMGKGIALSFKNRYKEMFEDYKNKCEEKQVEIGKIDIYKASDKYIINFPTKKDWRRNSKLIYIKKGLRNLLEIIPNQDIKSIAFPQLGCSNGRLSWEIVKETMEEYLNKC
jgi:O-acetyl-ADP-ribose deacetylase (regulator of RNase III)